MATDNRFTTVVNFILLIAWLEKIKKQRMCVVTDMVVAFVHSCRYVRTVLDKKYAFVTSFVACLGTVEILRRRRANIVARDLEQPLLRWERKISLPLGLRVLTRPTVRRTKNSLDRFHSCQN